MLGNDIIDLKLAKRENNWRRIGYLDKIFSLQEQSLTATIENPDELVWLIWSMKEAVYKIVNRLTGERFYKPKQFECFPNLSDSALGGRVLYNGEIFLTRSEVTSDLIHTTAVVNADQKLMTKYLVNSKTYVEEFNLHHPHIYLFKNEQGLPTITTKATGLQCHASISHHGQYVAVVWGSEK